MKTISKKTTELLLAVIMVTLIVIGSFIGVIATKEETSDTRTELTTRDINTYYNGDSVSYNSSALMDIYVTSYIASDNYYFEVKVYGNTDNYYPVQIDIVSEIPTKIGADGKYIVEDKLFEDTLDFGENTLVLEYDSGSYPIYDQYLVVYNDHDTGAIIEKGVDYYLLIDKQSPIKLI
tara:strand:- start:194 stop:727 length:534 start_codon:yes stop_codon:yes gene_type:complete